MSEFHDKHVLGVRARLVQCDEIWSFTYAKQKNVATAKAAPAEAGDTWTWTALDSESKLVISYMVGGRDSEYAMDFMDDLRQRLATRAQLTTDGHKAYLEAVEEAFGADIDYAMLREDLRRADRPEGRRAQVQPRRVHRRRQGLDLRQARQGACQHVARRAAEPHHADAHASLHAAHQRVLKEGREPQLCPRPSDAPHLPGDGRWPDRSSLGAGTLQKTRVGLTTGRAFRWPPSRWTC